MPSTPLVLVPARVLFAALLICVSAAALTVWAALQMPWLGVQLAPTPAGGVTVAQVTAGGPAARLPAATLLTAVSRTDSTGRLALEATDLIEEPDFFDEFVQMNAFFARQALLADLLTAPLVLHGTTASGNTIAVPVVPADRPLSSLPVPFWFQIIVSCAGFLLASWVWALRPGDWGARLFAVTGLAFPMFALPAAIYSTRELALDADVFRALSIGNHGGAFLFGCALLALFMMYPRRLVAPRWLWLLALVYGGWWLADSLQWVPDQDWTRIGILSEMLGAIGLALLQWRLSKGHPVDRAALRWLALSMLAGSGLFVFSTAGASLLGMFPPIPQAYAFGYFLIIYVGLALGLRRYRLFDLDRWAYRILLWVGGALAVILMDAALVIGLQLNPELSLGITLLACGWLYFPLRQWLWQKLSGRRDAEAEDALPTIINIAFATSRRQQEGRWNALLNQLYDPLEILPGDAGTRQAGVVESGLALTVPACGDMASRTLRLASRGRRLFSTRDALLAQSLTQLMGHAALGRDAYERGVQGERVRIARDMHDDLGARLLTLIHHAQRVDDKVSGDVARAALGDMRTMLTALEGEHIALIDALADWRAELSARCEAAGVSLDWRQAELPLPSGSDSGQWQVPLPPRQRATLERLVRETSSNALKHANPSWIRVEAALAGNVFTIGIGNDASGMPAQGDPAPWPEGRGMRGMRERLEQFGGGLAVMRTAHETQVIIRIPLTDQQSGAPDSATVWHDMPDAVPAHA